MKAQGRAFLNLKSSICVDNPTGSDTYPFSDEPTQIVQNTGIERNGGVSSIYEQETTFATAGANSIITKSGDLLQVDSSNNVRLNDAVIGNVGPCSIFRRGILPGSYLDAAWTATGTILAIKLVGTTITLDEYDPATATIINTRSTVFAGMPAKPFLCVALIKYVDMTFAAAQEFMITVRVGGFGAGTAWFLKETGTSSTSTSVITFANSAWKFAAAKYLIWNQGVAGLCQIGDIGTWTNLADVRWVTIDRFVATSDSRAILTFNVYKNAANTLTGYATVGYNGSGVYSATRVYSGIALAAVTASISNPINGPGYSECTFTRSDTGTTPYYYHAPWFAPTPAAAFLSNPLNVGAAPKINAYGKLTNTYLNATSLTEIKIGMVSDIPTYISVASITATAANLDNAGVLLSNQGELDETFYPHVVDDNSTFTRVIYRFNGLLYFVDIRSGQPHQIYRVSDTIYEINTISAINIVDTSKKQLALGTNDYNGAIVFANTGGSPIAHQVAATLKGPYSNSMDTGVKFAELDTSLASTSIFMLPGTNIPSFIDRQISYEVDIYVDGVYVESSLDPQTFVVDFSKAGTLYVSDTRLPIAMGCTFGDKVAFTDVETLFLGIGVAGVPDIDYDYVGYELGNDIQGIWQSFYLFGQRYIFDGFNIWLTSFNGSLYATKSFVCLATGMQFIAVAPTEVYFLSAFDTSLYVFNGGRALLKQKRMNDLRNSSNGIETITNGVYSVEDNTLLLQTAGTFVWIRDGVVTQNNKKANQTSITLYDTTAGIQIANNTLKWRYTFNALSASTVVPLTWQSAYHALKGNELAIVMGWVVTVFSPDGRVTAAVTLRCHAFDQDAYTLQRADITVNPVDWDNLGFIRLRIRPQMEKALASSVQIDYTAHLVITDVSVEYGDEAQAVIASARSK